MPSEPLDLTDLEPIELPFSHAGRDYLLCEATGDAGLKFRAALIKAVRREGGDTLPTDRLPETEVFLLSMCVWEVGPDGQRHKAPVPAAQLRLWPHRLLARLFARCVEISGLNPQPAGAEGAEKNGPTATPAGSTSAAS